MLVYALYVTLVCSPDSLQKNPKLRPVINLECGYALTLDRVALAASAAVRTDRSKAESPDEYPDE